jgi:hypothetical protein
MPLFTCRERFDDHDGESWNNYRIWLGRNDLSRIVTLDTMLCPLLIRLESAEDWAFVVDEDFMLDFFTDLEFVMQRSASFPRAMVLAVVREPTEEDIASFSRSDFEFVGFDVLDVHRDVSALVNCGGWPDVFSNSELSPRSGLVSSHERAYEIRGKLRELHPREPHADCAVWALWQRRENA